MALSSPSPSLADRLIREPSVLKVDALLYEARRRLTCCVPETVADVTLKADVFNNVCSV